MQEEVKQAFSSLAKSYDGKTILAYYEEKLAELSDIKYATKETFEGRKYASEFIQKEVIEVLKGFNKYHQDIEESL